MYDIRKRRGFQTVGELRAMLNQLPAHTRVSICGDLNCFFHEEQDGSLICLDCEDLNDHYPIARAALHAAAYSIEQALRVPSVHNLFTSSVHPSSK